MAVVVVLLVGWMAFLSGSSIGLGETADMQLNTDELVFTVVKVDPFVNLIQYGPDGGVKDECYLNYSLVKLQENAPVDISLFCSEGDVLVKVVGVYGLPINPLENGEFEQSDLIRVVVELNEVQVVE